MSDFAISLQLRDPFRPCPFCQEKDGLSFTELPPSRLTYTIEDGELAGEHTSHNGPAREYSCSNCSGEFLLFAFNHDGSYEA